MNKELTSIQVSVEYRDKLKEHCDKLGCNMNRFVEKLIENDIMKTNQKEDIQKENSDVFLPLLTPMTFLSGTKDDILLYIQSKIAGRVNFLDNIPEDALSTDLYELNSDPIEEQITNTINAGSPILSIIVGARVMVYPGCNCVNQFLRMPTFFITDFLEVKTTEMSHKIDPVVLTQMVDKKLSDLKFVNKLRRAVGREPLTDENKCGEYPKDITQMSDKELSNSLFVKKMKIMAGIEKAPSDGKTLPRIKNQRTSHNKCE